MKSEGVINLILPAREIISEYQPTENILQSMGTSTKELIEMFLNAWAEFKHVDRGAVHPMEMNPDLAFSYGLHARWLVMDVIFDAMERRIESKGQLGITERDRRDAEQVMMSIWNTLSTEIFSLLDELAVSELQVSQLRFVRWTGDDFIISLPRFRTAIENKNVLDTEDATKPTSPLCYYGNGGVDP